MKIPRKQASDEVLMDDVRRGDRAKLAILVRRHANSLLTFIRRTVGESHRADDLFQEVFLAVWVYRRRYRFPRKFRAWLFGIAANKCRAECRRAGGSPQSLQMLTAEVLDPDGHSPAEVAERRETARHVTEAVAQLPAGQRNVAILRIWNGLSYAEIGAALELKEATVRSHMFHALKSLRKYLEPRHK